MSHAALAVSAVYHEEKHYDVDSAALSQAQITAHQAGSMYILRPNAVTAQLYAAAVLNVLQLDAICEGYNAPACWTKAEIKMEDWDGSDWPYVLIHNDGPEVIHGYQGKPADWVAYRNGMIGVLEP